MLMNILEKIRVVKFCSDHLLAHWERWFFWPLSVLLPVPLPCWMRLEMYFNQVIITDNSGWNKDDVGCGHGARDNLLSPTMKRTNKQKQTNKQTKKLKTYETNKHGSENVYFWLIICIGLAKKNCQKMKKYQYNYSNFFSVHIFCPVCK